MRDAAFRWDAVIKVGGSLGRVKRRLPPLMRRIARLGRLRRLLIVPGGGAYADLVRSERRRLGLQETRAHRMALLAMDQYALALAQFCPCSRTARSIAEARRLAASGRVPILAVSTLVARDPGLERTFRLTSDSIAAWVARRIGAHRLILLKSVPGLPPRPIDRRDAKRLEVLGVVDPLFPRLMPGAAEVFIVDGRRSETLLLVAGGGTRRSPERRAFQAIRRARHAATGDDRARTVRRARRRTPRRARRPHPD